MKAEPKSNRNPKRSQPEATAEPAKILVKASQIQPEATAEPTKILASEPKPSPATDRERRAQILWEPASGHPPIGAL